MTETTPDPADVHTGTDRVELTEDEFDSTTGHHLDCWVNEGLGTCDKDCTRLLHARCVELEQSTKAERDALQATLDRVTAAIKSSKHKTTDHEGTVTGYLISDADLRAALTPEGKL